MAHALPMARWRAYYGTIGRLLVRQIEHVKKRYSAANDVPVVSKSHDPAFYHPETLLSTAQTAFQRRDLSARYSVDTGRGENGRITTPRIIIKKR
ncbi:TPA: hypothetical protein L0V32_001482 [Escherichia coli]|nr:hypothetical protein [Escherichia coli]